MTERKESFLIWLLVGLIILGALFTASSAWAEEPPCRPVGDTVVCNRAGFDVLVKKLIDAKAEGEKLSIKLDAMTQDANDTHKSLEACLSRPIPEPPKPPSAQRAVLPVVLGAVGASVLVGSIAADIGSSGRTIGAVVGSALVGTGIVLALP
jgi:hypothetical protein